jgi:O-antigen/teichoic acid export membrane protein
MTHKSDLHHVEVNTSATGTALRGRFSRGMGRIPLSVMFGANGRGQSLGGASIAALAVFVVGAGLTWLAQLVTARIIGADSYGTYAYVLAWVMLLGYFSTLGFHVSLLRFVPAYQAKEEWSLMRGVIQYAQRSAAATAVSIFLIGACWIAWQDSLRPELALTFLLGMAAVPFLALHFIGAAVVRAFGGIVTALAPERIVRDGLLLGIVAAAYWVNFHRLDATLAMGATLFSSIVMLGLVSVFLRRRRPPVLTHAKPTYMAKDWWRPTLPLTVIMIADNVMARSAILALGLAGNTRDAGVFAAAYSMACVTALPRMAVATAFAPTVSALYAQGDQVRLQSLSARAAGLSLLGTACAAVPLLLLSRPLLAWFGRDFVVGAPVVTILILGQVFAAACGPQQHLITMTGHERAGAVMLAVCASLSFAGCLVLIDPFGMKGAAIAMTLALVVWNVAMSIFILRALRLVPGVTASFKAMPRRKRMADCGI